MESTVNRFNYYDILEVSPHSDHHEVIVAYERARSTYSGENPALYTIFSEEEAKDFLRLIEEAYSVLGNKTLRTLYDERLGHTNLNPEDLSFQSLHKLSKSVPVESKNPVINKFEFTVDSAFEETIKKATEWDGNLLKKVREYKNIALERMSEITKISAYYINSIEKMDHANLPAPVFVRGYVSQISKVLGLPEKTVCDSYMKKFKTLV